MVYQGKKRLLIGIVILLSCLAGVLVLLGPSRVSGQISSPRRWNPRRAPSNAVFLGDSACGECHKKIFGTHAQSGMAISMERVAESAVLSANPQLRFQNGPYTYEIKRDGKQSIYSVTDGKETISVPIVYAFGQGRMGQTYVLQRDNNFYESLVSFYNEPKALDFTIGAPRNVPDSLVKAFGRLLAPNEVISCFSCHSTGAVGGGGLQLDKFVHGIRCEACHGPGGPHVAAVKSGESGAKFIFNPGHLNGDDLTQKFCASCHRGSEEFSILQGLQMNNVRFQPYRIFHSKCYSDDRKISCTACHNPHEPLKEDPAYYDSKCLACHAVKGQPAAEGSLPSCPVSTKDCTSCHMPKIELKTAHFKFTDHFIRIVKPGEKYPN
jgi:hypothetical protein